LKDKRSVVRSAKERIQGRLKVSIVSNSSTVCDQVLANVMNIASTLPDAVLTDRATEIVPFGDGGRGIQGGIEQLFSTSNDDDYDDEGGSS
jgi:uncharacterized protein